MGLIDKAVNEKIKEYQSKDISKLSEEEKLEFDKALALKVFANRKKEVKDELFAFNCFKWFLAIISIVLIFVGAFTSFGASGDISLLLWCLGLGGVIATIIISLVLRKEVRKQIGDNFFLETLEKITNEREQQESK